MLNEHAKHCCIENENTPNEATAALGHFKGL